MSEKQTQQGTVKTLVTHDFVLDVYEQSLDEPDENKREAIVQTARVLSESIGTYLVDVNEWFLITNSWNFYQTLYIIIHMSKKKQKSEAKQTPEATAEQPELSPEEQAKRSELVTFVANNILNSVTLNQTVTILQQVAMRDANTIVSQADDTKLQELEQALEASKKPADASEPAGEIAE